MGQFFIPKTKQKALEILSRYYPDDKGLKRKPKAQLIEIVKEVRRRGYYGNR